MQDVHVKLSPILPWQKQYSTRRRLFTVTLDLNLRKKLINKWSIALHGAGEDQMDRPCTKCSITRSRGGEEYPAYNKKKEV
jgi:hypothetical protein